MFTRLRTALLVVILALGVAVASPSPALAGQPSHHRHHVEVTRGAFQTLPGGAALGYEVRGRAVMIRFGRATVVSLHVRGLDARTTYPVHVHNAPCSATPPGGSHYQHEVGGPVDAINEIWPAVTTRRTGAGFGFATHGHRARADAQAIVIHNPLDTSIRLACLDLR